MRQRPLVIALVSLGIVFGLGALLSAIQPAKDGADAKLLLYCAAGLERPINDLAVAYERQFGTRIEVRYGGSGTLLANLEIAGDGDIFIAGDDSFTDIAEAKGLVSQRIPLAHMAPVLAVAQGNPKGVAAANDLLDDQVRIGFADPDATAAGAIAREHFRASGHWDGLSRMLKKYVQKH
jgi:molybdate transport system substrate-binding protein